MEMQKRVKRIGRLTYGVGLNDAPYQVTLTDKTTRKSIWRCPYFEAWRGMLKRCYTEQYLRRVPAYRGCSVDERWLNSFMEFRAWMEKQDWEGRQLDKDLLIKGNKVYSPEACCFISAKTNSFLTDSGAVRGKWPLGVTVRPESGKFRASVNNPFSGKRESLGQFNCPYEAHEEWRKRKHELACMYADLETDPRIAQALRTRFAK